MKITSGMLPFELVHEVTDEIRAQFAKDRLALDFLRRRPSGLVLEEILATILNYGEADRRLINEAIGEGAISQGACYEECHLCCSMKSRYEVETFDILLSYGLNSNAVITAYRTGRLDGDMEWCGLLEDGMCIIHPFKPYTCLVTSPSSRGAEKEGCCFAGDSDAPTAVHKQTLVAAGRMRKLFRKYLPELPEFAGSNINQAFQWAVRSLASIGPAGKY
jgi:Fe-S-cluster containining protein